jgi:hypothetical protein
VEDPREEREQRLGAIELKEGADAGEEDGSGGERAGCGVRLDGRGWQDSG